MTIGPGIEAFRQADAVIGEFDDDEAIRISAATNVDLSGHTGRMSIFDRVRQQFRDNKANRSRAWRRDDAAGFQCETQLRTTGEGQCRHHGLGNVLQISGQIDRRILVRMRQQLVQAGYGIGPPAEPFQNQPDFARIQSAGYRSVLTLPLMMQDRVIGALSVADMAGRVFTDEEVRLARAFGDQAAVELEVAPGNATPHLALQHPMPAEDVGSNLIRAIRANRFHVLTHPHARPLVESRFEAILEDFDFAGPE